MFQDLAVSLDLLVPFPEMFLFISFILKGNNLLKKEQILSFGSRPRFESISFFRNANRKSQILSPSEELTEKHGVSTHRP